MKNYGNGRQKDCRKQYVGITADAGYLMMPMAQSVTAINKQLGL